MCLRNSVTKISSVPIIYKITPYKANHKFLKKISSQSVRTLMWENVIQKKCTYDFFSLTYAGIISWFNKFQQHSVKELKETFSFLSFSNCLRKKIRLLQKWRYIVNKDFYWTHTTKFCNILVCKNHKYYRFDNNWKVRESWLLKKPVI